MPLVPPSQIAYEFGPIGIFEREDVHGWRVIAEALEGRLFEVDWAKAGMSKATRDHVRVVGVLPQDDPDVVICWQGGLYEERATIHWRCLIPVRGVSDEDLVDPKFVELAEMLRKTGHHDVPDPKPVQRMRAEKWKMLAMIAAEANAAIRTNSKMPFKGYNSNQDFANHAESLIVGECAIEDAQEESDRWRLDRYEAYERRSQLDWRETQAVHDENELLKADINAGKYRPKVPDGYTLVMVPTVSLADIKPPDLSGME